MRLPYGGTRSDYVQDTAGNVKPGTVVEVRDAATEAVITDLVAPADYNGTAFPAGKARSDADGLVAFQGPDGFAGDVDYRAVNAVGQAGPWVRLPRDAAAAVAALEATLPLTYARLHSAVDLSNYPRTGGETNDSGRFTRALADLVDGGTLLIPDATYVASGISTTGRSVHYVCPDGEAVIEQASNAAVINFTGAFDTIHAVTGAVTEARLFGDGLATTVTKLTLGTALHGYKRGDVLRLASDDTIPAARTTDRRRGEFAQVGDVSGADVWLTGLARETYTTNPRVARMQEKTITVRNLRFTSPASGDAAGWNVGAVAVEAAFRARFERLAAVDMYGPRLSLIGCYAYVDDDGLAKNLANQPSLSRYGYGINDQGCEFGTVTNLTGINCRHVFTTNTASVVANSAAIWRHGRSAHTTIAYGRSLGSTNTAWDTHEEAYDLSFVECVAVGSMQGNSASGSGFVARGKKIAFHRCRAYQCYNGFTIQEQFAGSTSDVLLDECEAWGGSGPAINAVTTDNTMRIDRLRIKGGVYDSEQWTLYATRADIDIIGGTKMISRYGSGAFSGPVRLDDVLLAFDRLSLDLSGAVEPANVRAFKVQDTATKIIGDRLDLKIGAAGVSHWFAFDGGGSLAGRLVVRDLRADKKKSPVNGLTGFELGWTAEDTTAYASFRPEYPTTVMVTAAQDPAAQSGWATPPTFQATDFLCVRYNSDGIQGSWIEWDVVVPEGTWKAALFCRTAPDAPLLDLSFDGVLKGSFDTYESGIQSRRKDLSNATFTLTESRRYRMRLTASNKNAASTSYFGRINAVALTKVA